jgi:hypothetical protein
MAFVSLLLDCISCSAELLSAFVPADGILSAFYITSTTVFLLGCGYGLTNKSASNEHKALP